MYEKIKKILPGLFFCYAVTLVATALCRLISTFEMITTTIILGALIASFCRLPKSLETGIHFSSKTLLNTLVILLGFSLNSKILLELGTGLIFSIILMIVLVLLLSLVLGRYFKLSSSLSLLIGIGSGICGTSAIAASSYLVTDKRDDIGAATTVIHVVGTLGLILLPSFIGFSSYFDEKSGAILIGGSLQALSHVLAAGYLLDAEMGELALAIKMGRVSMLIPLVILLAAFSQKEKNISLDKKSSLFKKIPFYIYAFILSVTIGNLGLLPDKLLLATKSLSHSLLALAMAGIGLGLNLKDSWQMIGKGFFLGVFIFLFQIAFLFCIL